VKNAGENRCIIVGFQTDNGGDQTKNPAVFDHVNPKNMYVMLNATRYPAVDYNLSSANQQYSRAYGDASVFGVRYFGMDELITQSNIITDRLQATAPFVCF